MQRVSIEVESEKEKTFSRSIELCFKNIACGQVKVTVDGEKYEAESDDNGELTVRLPEVAPGQRFEVEITEIVEKNAEPLEKLRRELTFFQMSNNEKDRMLDKLARCKETEYASTIESLELPGIYKKRLLEVLN